MEQLIWPFLNPEISWAFPLMAVLACMEKYYHQFLRKPGSGSDRRGTPLLN